MVTLLDARRKLLKDVPELGKTHTLTALATGSITIGSLANTNFPATKFRNAIAYRGEAASAADYRRYLGAYTAASGLIVHTGANYSDTTVTNEEVEIWYDPEIVPDIDVNQAFADAISQLRVLTRIPLAHGPIDYDMQASGVTNWTPNSGTPFAKQTTQAEVFWGGRSGAFTDGGSGGDYTDSALYHLSSSAQVNMFSIVRADTGTSTLKALDGSGNVQGSVSSTQETPVLMWKRVGFDSADEQIRLRIEGTTVSAQGDWGPTWFVREDDYYFPLNRVPGWIDSTHHITGLSVGRPRQAGSETDTYIFGSMEYEELREGIDFYFQRQHADANPDACYVLKTALMSEPLFLTVSSPWSAPYGVTAAFSAETDTTGCRTDLLVAQVKLLLGERFPAKLGYLKEEGAKEKLRLISMMAGTPEQPRRTGWQKGMFR